MAAATLYTPELLAKICERLAKGEPLAQICRDKGMPDPATVWRWREADSTVAQAIGRARETGYDAIADRLRETARGAGDSAGDVQRDKLIVETDLKLLAKWCPKRYGDRIALEGEVKHTVSLAEVAAAVQRSPVLAALNGRS